jgi:hypothetical protein
MGLFSLRHRVQTGSEVKLYLLPPIRPHLSWCLVKHMGNFTFTFSTTEIVKHEMR